MIKYISIIVTSILIFSSCYKEETVIIERPDGWTIATHSNLASTNYETVFNQSSVNKLMIEINSDDWSEMQDDIEDLYGGTTSGPGGGGPGGGGPGGGTTFSDEKPTTIPCQIYFNDIQWFDVGVRYKGNSSLSSAYSSGKSKLPLRLDFDYFEDENELIKNQRFYGFKELSLSSNFNDDSFLHEKVASDLFRSFGVPAPRTSFYEIYIKNGDGNGYVYYGLYTMVEVVFDSMLENQFGSNTGNCYKPDGDGAAFGLGTYSTEYFEKKTNESSNWDDVESLYNIINSDERTSDIESWKTNLESVFNVDGYLKYLAANTVIQNWDTYGNMTHNYFLYNNPSDGKLNWIPWDNNEALSDDKNMALDFDFNSISNSEWPLIGYIYDTPEYKTIYDNYIDQFIEAEFKPSNISTTYSSWHNLISSSVLNESGSYSYLSSYSDFTSSLTTLNNHASQRYSTASSYTP